MNTVNELERLHDLHTRGGLTAEEFSQAKARLLSSQTKPDLSYDYTENWLKNLRRSSQDSCLGGVCGGLGEHTPIPAWVWRIIWVILTFCYGVGLLLYILCWIFMPKEPAACAPKMAPKKEEAKPPRTPFNA